MRRYPMDALLEATGLTESGLTRRAGISGSTLKLARERGFTPDAADRYAVRCGLTPWEVWPDYGMDPCVECGTLFVPSRAGHAMCSKTCRERRRMRAKYQTNPAWAEAQRERRRAYYEACGDYEKAEAKRRYWLDPERQREARRERHRKVSA